MSETRTSPDRQPPAALRIVVTNAKGGCGKTTIATNLASFCAGQGEGTALFDYDPQGSSMRWMQSRPQSAPAIHGVAAYEAPPTGMTRSWQMRLPAGTTKVIIDTPAGFGGFELEDRVAEADVVLIPVLPSAIDIQATEVFIHDLLHRGKAPAHKKRIAIIANRTRSRTKAMQKLEAFLENLGIPVIARLRDTQQYLNAVELGVGVHELEERDEAQDVTPWAQIVAWLDGKDLTPPSSGPARPQSKARRKPAESAFEERWRI